MAAINPSISLHHHISSSSSTISAFVSPPKPLLHLQTFSSHFSHSVSISPSICTTPFRFRRSRSFSTVVSSSLRKLSETEPVPVTTETEALIPSGSGVYAVYDSKKELQFIGLSRNIAASVATHQKRVPELCVSVKVLSFLLLIKLPTYLQSLTWFSFVFYCNVEVWRCPLICWAKKDRGWLVLFQTVSFIQQMLLWICSEKLQELRLIWWLDMRGI